MVLVTLSGPDKTDTTATAKAAKANLPVTLTITGNDGTNTVNYAFTLDKWFINRSGVSVPVTDYNGSFTDNHRDWCAGLNGSNYILASVKDLTNSVTTGWVSGSSPGNYYQRVVGDGLLSEWGSMYLFSGSNFPSALFVTRDMVYGTKYFTVNGALGTIGTTAPYTGNYAVCVSQ